MCIRSYHEDLKCSVSHSFPKVPTLKGTILFENKSTSTVVNIRCMNEVLNDATVNCTNPVHVQTFRRIHILVTL